MGHSVTIRLNKPANIFVAGDATGISVRGGVKYYDRDAKSELYTNYEAVIFSSNAEQIQFYRNALIEGAIVEISAHNQRVKKFQGNNDLIITIELLDARFGLIGQSAARPQAQSNNSPSHLVNNQNSPPAYQPRQPQNNSMPVNGDFYSDEHQ